jgi:hypothetical protein
MTLYLADTPDISSGSCTFGCEYTEGLSLLLLLVLAPPALLRMAGEDTLRPLRTAPAVGVAAPNRSASSSSCS